ncbi:MAG: pyridoxamine 5'-phosphate oxidase family protein [Planctomycetaceae bacterium]
MNSQPRSLPEIESDIWERLAGSVSGEPGGWRLPVMTTSGPHARTIVLRAVSQQARELVFHTDVRSPKVQQLQSNSAANLVFYDTTSMTQIVVQGTAKVHTDDELTDREWNCTPGSSRRAYLAPMAPGQRTTEPSVNLPQSVVGRIPDESELEAGRTNFAVISVGVTSIDWLHLDRDGNLRALFEYDAGQEFSATWLAC